jgi:hypothetical protein
MERELGSEQLEVANKRYFTGISGDFRLAVTLP